MQQGDSQLSGIAGAVSERLWLYWDWTALVSGFLGHLCMLAAVHQ